MRVTALVSIIATSLSWAEDRPANDTLRIQEFVISVSSIEKTAAAFTDVLRWRVLHTDQADITTARVWGLDVDTPIREVLVGNADSDRGFVRLVEIPIDQRQVIRPNARWWDTGGTFNLNVLVKDLDSTVTGLRNLDWHSDALPTRYEIGETVKGKSMIMVGPDDLVLSFQERISPPLQGWPPFAGASHIEVGYQIVSSLDDWLEFFGSTLGWPTSQVTERSSEKPIGPNHYGLPHNLSGVTDHLMGSVALPTGGKQSLVGRQHLNATGYDYQDRAGPPHLGIAAIRILVPSVLSVAQRLRDHQVPIAAEPQILRVPPYGVSRVMAARIPGGSGQWLEFLETGVEPATREELESFFRGGRFANWVRFNNRMRGTVRHREGGTAHVTWASGLSEEGVWVLKGNAICTAWHKLRDFREQCAHYYRIGPNAYQSFTVDGRPDGLLYWE